MIAEDNATIDHASHVRLRVICMGLFMASWLLHTTQMLVANMLSGVLAAMVSLLLVHAGCRVSRIAWITCSLLGMLMLASLVMSPLLSALGVYAWLRGGTLFSMVLMFALLSDYFSRQGDAVRHFAIAMVLSAVLYSLVLGCFMASLGQLSSWNWWESPPLGIHLRLIPYGLVPAAIAAVWLIMHAFAPSQRVMLFLALTLILAVQLWSGGRAGLFAIALGVAVLAWCHRGVSYRRSWLLVMLSALLALFLSQLVATNQPGMGWWHALERTSQAESMDQMSSKRLLLWQMTWPYIEQRFMVGWGGEAFLYLWERTPGAWPQFQPHNGWLQLHLEWGVFFPMVTWGTLLVMLLSAVRLLNKCAKENLSGFQVLTFGTALTVSWFFMAAVDGVTYHGMAMVLFAVSCSCMCAGLLIQKNLKLQTALAEKIESR